MIIDNNWGCELNNPHSANIFCRRLYLTTFFYLASLSFSSVVFAQNTVDVPDIPPVEARNDGSGPYKRLIFRGAFMIDGTGAPAQGPVDIVVENDRITEVSVVGAPKIAIDPADRPVATEGTEEINLSGMFVLPGFVDTHLHLHTMETGQRVPPEYVLKLWLAHGITSGRTVGSDNTRWMLETARRSALNEITGPRMEVYPMFNTSSLGLAPANTPDEAREHIQLMKQLGATGVKFIG
ncbi:MAG: hypothetical protein ACE1ZA_14985, partial [Pseudomonadales bacterium]